MGGQPITDFLIIYHDYIKEINMLRPNFINVCISVFVSSIIFLIIPMIMDGDYRLLEFNNIRNGQDLFYYLWIVMFFPIIDIILFSLPLYFGLKIKNKFLVAISLFTIFSIEYFIYVYFTSHQVFDEDGLQKVIISMIIFAIFFYKSLRMDLHQY